MSYLVHHSLETITLIFRCAPVGVGSLIATGISQLENVGETITSLGICILIVLLGLIIYNFVLLIPIIGFLTKTSPGPILKKSAKAMYIGSATGSA